MQHIHPVQEKQILMIAQVHAGTKQPVQFTYTFLVRIQIFTFGTVLLPLVKTKKASQSCWCKVGIQVRYYDSEAVAQIPNCPTYDDIGK